MVCRKSRVAGDPFVNARQQGKCGSVYLLPLHIITADDGIPLILPLLHFANRTIVTPQGTLNSRLHWYAQNCARLEIEE